MSYAQMADGSRRQDGHTCPRCGGDLGQFPAISRWDNLTQVCSTCGTIEGLAQLKAQNDGTSVSGAVDPVGRDIIAGPSPWRTPPSQTRAP